MLNTLFESQADRSLARAREVGKHGFLPYAPSDVQRALLYKLEYHVGRDKAVSVGELAERLKLTPRAVKDAVRELRMRPFQVPIGSSRDQKDGGYFLCATVEERLETARQYSRQALSELMVWRDMLEPHELAEEMGQMQLTLAGESRG